MFSDKSPTSRFIQIQQSIQYRARDDQVYDVLDDIDRNELMQKRKSNFLQV